MGRPPAKMPPIRGNQTSDSSPSLTPGGFFRYGDARWIAQTTLTDDQSRQLFGDRTFHHDDFDTIVLFEKKQHCLACFRDRQVGTIVIRLHLDDPIFWDYFTLIAVNTTDRQVLFRSDNNARWLWFDGRNSRLVVALHRKRKVEVDVVVEDHKSARWAADRERRDGWQPPIRLSDSPTLPAFGQ